MQDSTVTSQLLKGLKAKLGSAEDSSAMAQLQPFIHVFQIRN